MGEAIRMRLLGMGSICGSAGRLGCFGVGWDLRGFLMWFEEGV